MSGRPPSGPSRPEVYAADSSVCNNRDITLGNVEGSLNFNDEVEGRYPSGNGGAVKMITSHKVDLIRRLMADPSFILQHVQAKEIITDREYQKVKSVAQPEEKVTELLDCVILKGEDYCSRFLDILKAPDVLETYPQLEGIMSKWC